jgi:hypothetical protein
MGISFISADIKIILICSLIKMTIEEFRKWFDEVERILRLIIYEQEKRKMDNTVRWYEPGVENKK